MRRAGDGATGSQEHEPQRSRHGGCTGSARAAKSRTQPRNPLGCVRDGASNARVQSGRSWYAPALEQYAPAQTIATVLSVLGACSQDPCRAHACLPALRACHAARSEQRNSGAHRCARYARHAWNGRGGETQTSTTATWYVPVCDPRNPHYNRASGLVAGEFIALEKPDRLRDDLRALKMDTSSIDAIAAFARARAHDDAALHTEQEVDPDVCPGLG